MDKAWSCLAAYKPPSQDDDLPSVQGCCDDSESNVVLELFPGSVCVFLLSELCGLTAVYEHRVGRKEGQVPHTVTQTPNSEEERS